jgi:hypothetical protein
MNTTKKATQGSANAARKAYRNAVAKQRSLPAEEQWTMGHLVKHLLAVAQNETEALRCGM